MLNSFGLFNSTSFLPITQVFALAVAEALYPGQCVLLGCYNMGATQALRRGSCKTEVGAMLCAAFWTLAAATTVPVWVESVAGALNPADRPARACEFCASSLECVSKRCGVPAYVALAQRSRNDLFIPQSAISGWNGPPPPPPPPNFGPVLKWTCRANKTFVSPDTATWGNPFPLRPSSKFHDMRMEFQRILSEFEVCMGGPNFGLMAIV